MFILVDLIDFFLKTEQKFPLCILSTIVLIIKKNEERLLLKVNCVHFIVVVEVNSIQIYKQLLGRAELNRKGIICLCRHQLEQLYW